MGVAAHPRICGSGEYVRLEYLSPRDETDVFRDQRFHADGVSDLDRAEVAAVCWCEISDEGCE